MGPEHWLAKSLDKEELDTAYGDIRVDLHKMEYIFLNVFLWCDELKNRSLPWKCQPQRVCIATVESCLPYSFDVRTV